MEQTQYNGRECPRNRNAQRLGVPHLKRLNGMAHVCLFGRRSIQGAAETRHTASTSTSMFSTVRFSTSIIATTEAFRTAAATGGGGGQCVRDSGGSEKREAKSDHDTQRFG